MLDINFTCSFSGHRDIVSETISDSLRVRIREAINDGYNHFICGMALGFDMLAAQIVLEYKKDISDLKLECALPCETQAVKWSEPDQKKYIEILDKATSITVISKEYTPYCMWQRNQYMINKSSLIIAYYDGRTKGGTYYSMKYAKNKNIDVWLV